MTHGHRCVVGGRLGEPGIQIGIQIPAKGHMGLGIADGQDGFVFRFSLAGNQAQLTRARLGQPQCCLLYTSRCV